MEPLVISVNVQDERLLIVPEVVQRLRCSKNIVLGLIRNGVLPAIKSGREYRISNLSLVRFIHAAEGKDLKILAQGTRDEIKEEAV